MACVPIPSIGRIKEEGRPMRLLIIAAILLSWPAPKVAADEISAKPVSAFQVAATKPKKICYFCRAKNGKTETICRGPKKKAPDIAGVRSCTKL
jgi:ribosomal protein L40E